MARYRVEGPDGAVHVFEGPDDATPNQVTAFAAQHFGQQKPVPAAATTQAPARSLVDQFLGPEGGPEGSGLRNFRGKNALMGALRGAAGIGATIAQPFQAVEDALTGKTAPTLSGLVSGQRPDSSNAEMRAGIDGGVTATGADPNSLSFNVAKLATEIAGTSGVGGVVAAPVRALTTAVPRLAPALAPIAEAITTGGMRAGQSAPGFVAGAKNLATRAFGGAVTGGASAGLVNHEDAGTGAGIGAAIPVVGKATGAAGKAVASLVRPFFKAGQERITGDALRQFSTNPDALSNLRAAQEVIPGSAPTAVMASGDTGLAGLSRTMQSASPQYATELTARQAAQNAARTSAIEGVAGNTGKLTIAKEARDKATAAMRESALDAAGVVPADQVLSRLDSMLKAPSNAGRIAQQALSNVRDQIAKFTENGGIDARALYAIRKDINEVLGGKLQGEAGNLKYASGQLIDAKALIDNVIDQAGRKAQQSTSTALAPAGANIALPGAAGGAGAPRASWKQYLAEYSKQSVPINQMELLDDVMKRVQTGTVDKEGNLVLSAAKLNNLMKNEGQDLMKKLAPDQIDLLRRLAADLNASQLATNAGKAAGSNTVQNLASNNILQSTLGNKLGGSTPATAILGRVMQLPYGHANKQITEQLGAALLDPQEAARLMQNPAAQSAIARLFDQSGARALSYRAAPVVAAQR